MSIREMSIDIETFSSEDLSRSGVYRYAEAPDFSLLLFGYAADGGEVRVVDLASGARIPEEVMAALLDDSVIKWAFNAAFERVCLSRFLRSVGRLGKGEFLSPAAWRCSMVWCAYLGLPMSLAGAGEALNLPQQKMAEGKSLIRYFCRPCAPTLLNGGSARNGPAADPNRWRTFVDYNRRDVETERAIQTRLKGYPVPESVWEEYVLDQEINDRGIRVDVSFVRRAQVLDSEAREELTARMREKTALANPASVTQVRKWLADHGEEAASLGKKEVAEMLLSAPEEIREVLLLRQQLSKSSVKKYAAMEETVCRDGRCRGMLQFYGASRSGRWAGRHVQLQNLPQNHVEPIEEARNLVLAGDAEGIRSRFGSVPDVLSELIRTAFVPSRGRKFIVADFSAIEARVLAWLAGESWRIRAFEAGEDIYCSSASRMFRVPVEKNGVNGHLRQRGKVAELALGYGGSVGALKSMGALAMGVPEEELQPLVDAWRGANENIVRFWWNVDTVIRTALRNKTTLSLGPLTFSCRAGMLFVLLPSGRSLSYVRPRLETGERGREEISYMGLNAAKKWSRIASWGPKFVENIVQGISRDLLCAALFRLRSRAVVAHVHDEVILEADAADSVEEVCRLMAETPSWAEGLPLRADGYECAFYMKQ